MPCLHAVDVFVLVMNVTITFTWHVDQIFCQQEVLHFMMYVGKYAEQSTGDNPARAVLGRRMRVL